jgi:penicillin-binding protein 1C
MTLCKTALTPARALVGVLVGVVSCALLAAHLVPLPSRLSAPHSPVLRFADAAPAHVFLSADEKWRLAVDLGRVDPDYVAALLRFEDKRFRLHPGVDPLALGRAAVKNLRRGRVVSGGSTITMQLVRVLEPRRRTLAAKLVEAARAVQLELRLSKDEILAAYLSFIPFGRNVEGVEAAAWSYFGHGADNLSAAEIATLLAVPQDPTRRHPGPGRAPALRAARDRVAARLSLAPAAEITATPLPAGLRPFPRHAAHAAYWLRPAAELRSTLDQRVQKHVETLVQAARGPIRDLGVRNVAVVVVDNATRGVRALVGGFDFWASDPASQIPAFAIPRSPGSALKPFIYALGFDLGLVLPDHLVPDVPRTVGSYHPKNYDGRYQGLVNLEWALAQSLNVPFVDLLERIGLERFLALLRAGGATHFAEEPGSYGLSVAAGGIELTPLEMTALYASLADDGHYLPLRFTPEAAPESVPIMSAGATHLTRRALRSRDRPDFPRRRDFTRLPAETFWKTGTSFGHKDAWAIGARGAYTAAVWLGNADYAGSHALRGAELAAPLLFDVLEGLGRAGSATPDLPPPEELMEVQVCAYSGHVPGPGCTHRKTTLALRSNVPTTPCPFHVELDVDRATGLALAPMCRAGRDVERRTFMVWPASVKRYLGDSLRLLPEPPSPHPDCREAAAIGSLVIASPRENHIVLLLPGVAADKQELPFEAEAPPTAGQLSWFVDGAFARRLAATERFWWTPAPGRHEIAVADERGRLAQRRVEVRVLR